MNKRSRILDLLLRIQTYILLLICASLLFVAAREAVVGQQNFISNYTIFDFSIDALVLWSISYLLLPWFINHCNPSQSDKYMALGIAFMLGIICWKNNSYFKKQKLYKITSQYHLKISEQDKLIKELKLALFNKIDPLKKQAA